MSTSTLSHSAMLRKFHKIFDDWAVVVELEAATAGTGKARLEWCRGSLLIYAGVKQIRLAINPALCSVRNQLVFENRRSFL